MKKTVISIALILTVILNIFSLTTSAANTNTNDIKIMADGEYIKFDVAPFIENGQTFVPFRAIFTAFGMTVSYDENLRRICAELQTSKNSIVYYIFLNDNTLNCTGIEYASDNFDKLNKSETEKIGAVTFSLSLEYKIVNGRTFVPARIIAESLGCKVDWNGATRTVIINSENAVITGSEYIKGLPAQIILDRSEIVGVKLSAYKSMEDDIVKLFNETRASKELSLYEQDADLTRIARQTAQEMADNHMNDYPADKLKDYIKSNYGHILYFSFNYAINVNTANDVAAIWQNSANTQNNQATTIGVGAAKTSDGMLYWICIRVQPLIFRNEEKSVLEDEVIRLINIERSKENLGNLVKNSDLMRIANMKAQDIADKGYFAHNSPTYGTPAEMAAKYAPQLSYRGENLATGQTTAQEVVVAWMNSPSHKNVIMGKDSNRIGIGVVVDKNGIFKWAMVLCVQK